MTLNLGVTDTTGNPILSVSVDPGGTGSVGTLTINGSGATIPLTYPNPGIYTPTVTVTDALGSHSQTVTIVAQDPSVVDNLLRNIYGGMLTKLKAGDLNGALTAVTDGMHVKYQKVFTLLGPSLSSAVDQIGVLQTGALDSEMAEYTVLCTTGGSAHTLLHLLLARRRWCLAD